MSSSCSQDPVDCPLTEPYLRRPCYPHLIYIMSGLILSSSLCLGLSSVKITCGMRQKSCMYSYSLMCAKCAAYLIHEYSYVSRGTSYEAHTMRFSSASFHFILSKSRNYPQHHNLKYTQSAFNQQCQRSSLIRTQYYRKTCTLYVFEYLSFM
jgi:hypothetical protein